MAGIDHRVSTERVVHEYDVAITVCSEHDPQETVGIVNAMRFNELLDVIVGEIASQQGIRWIGDSGDVLDCIIRETQFCRAVRTGADGIEQLPGIEAVTHLDSVPYSPSFRRSKMAHR